MKKVFLGLLVAGVALAGSAFTNVSSFQGPNRLVTAKNVGGTVYTFNSTQTNPAVCNSTPDPCLIKPIAPYVLPASGTISSTDLFDNTKVQILSKRNGY